MLVKNSSDGISLPDGMGPLSLGKVGEGHGKYIIDGEEPL